MDLKPLLHRRQDRHPSGMAEFQRRTGVDGHEQILNRGHRRAVFADHLAEAVVDKLKPLRQ